MRQRHRAVLADQAVDDLVTEPDGIYLDATFGRGGHARPAAAGAGSARAADRARSRSAGRRGRAPRFADPRFHIEHTVVFTPRCRSLRSHGVGAIDGALLDHRHLVAADRRRPRAASLGATMARSTCGWTRHAVDCGRNGCARASIDELTQVIRNYGEERFAASDCKGDCGSPRGWAADSHHRRPCRARGRRDSPQEPRGRGTASGHADISGYTDSHQSRA